MSSKKDLSIYALNLLRTMPRVSLGNIAYIKGTTKKNKRGRGIHGGVTHGFGNTGRKARNLIPPVGFENGSWPFHMRFPEQHAYKDIHLRRQYPQLSLLKLQRMIDLNRVDVTKPIDLASIVRTGLLRLNPSDYEFGFQLTDEGANTFEAKVNIEVQWASEPAIAAIEKNGGTICTAYYDVRSLHILNNAKKFFLNGEAIPRRMIPPEDAIVYYTSAASRGYLADPDEISKERLVLSQKYGYPLVKLEDDPDYEMLTMRKDPRQIFYGLEPGWVVNLHQKVILKPKEERLLEFYTS